MTFFLFMNSKDDSSATHKPNARRSVNADVGKVTVATGSISILADMLAGRLTLFRHVCLHHKCVCRSFRTLFFFFFLAVCMKLCNMNVLPSTFAHK